MSSKKFILVSPKNRTVYNFRGDLIRAIQAMGYEVIVTGPDQTDIEGIRALGVQFVEISMNKTGTSVKSDVAYYRQLKALFEAEQPEAVLGYTIKPVVYGSLAAHAAGVKNINALITGGGYTFIAKSLKARVLGCVVRWLYRLGLKRASHVMFQNPDDLQEFVSRGLVTAEKCRVVNGSGVNMEHFAPLPFPEDISFFMLSRLLKSKGVLEYLAAAEAVKKRHPEVRCYLLGKFETAMQDAVPEAEVRHYFDEGIVERFEETTDVRPYYGKCSVYVLPSYREGTPRTVLEAMAMGRPVITTDTNGCRETVVNGETGFLVPVRDSQALSEAMESFVRNPLLCTEMGRKSLEFCREKFEVGKVNASMLEIMNL